MDVLYVGGIALFAALTFALISGCETLMRVGRGETKALAASAAPDLPTQAGQHGGGARG